MSASLGKRSFTDTSNALCGTSTTNITVKCSDEGGGGAKGDKGDPGVGVANVTVSQKQVGS